MTGNSNVLNQENNFTYLVQKCSSGCVHKDQSVASDYLNMSSGSKFAIQPDDSVYVNPTDGAVYANQTVGTNSANKTGGSDIYGEYHVYDPIVLVQSNRKIHQLPIAIPHEFD